ncbi:hypothetical protein L207DRAFT_631245 [Hyaloscypha variabilis F]|uniref:DUF7918 domain-containing protein n=1 Tax=Hyaloscypha variabilis (strain UAMH 11265 / GT02V1 / F) TaxID=1149755 RepID=A0A2J6RX51_HYAVF|nr:hypothetical protein L207DRAFT_631245 [Hyaloscypha variabilis F]
MVILREEGNEYEVRVKRVPQGTCFKEYVKIGDPRNIAKFYAEDDLRKGDAKATIDCVNIDSEEQHVGAPFAFHNLEIDDQLVNEADAFGVDPKDLANFTIKVERFKWEGTRTRATTDSATFGAQKIDKESYKSHRISFSISLDGPRIATKTVKVVNGPSTSPDTLVFKFHYRTSEFLEQLNIVPYPPPVYCYPWDNLRETEQMIALSDLQLLNVAEHRARTGSLTDSGEERKEWRSWYNLNPGQRKYTFEKLQQEHKAHARVEVQKRIAAIPQHRIIVLDEDGPSIGRVESTRFGSQLSNQRSRGARIKQELIDLEGQDETTREQLLTKGIKTKPIDVDDSQIVTTTIWPSKTIKRCREDSEQREVKRVKFEEDLPVDMSRYEVFEGEEQGDD